ncbi:MAG: hypothetical protein IH588_19980 [Anaerolineales bacterium]|nr:hypothetical protein [Anaerolineales bacterium]
MTSHRKTNTGLVTVIVSFSCMICCVGILIIYALGSSDTLFPTSAPIRVLDTPLPISTLIALTYSAAGTQTAMVSTPEPLPTATLAPLENIPTATVFIFQLQTDVAQPTEYIYSTNTPFSLQTIQPTMPLQSAVCSCSGDTLNCKDFNSQAEAQACFNYCVSQGVGDIHQLDQNNNNDACEDF